MLRQGGHDAADVEPQKRLGLVRGRDGIGFLELDESRAGALAECLAPRYDGDPGPWRLRAAALRTVAPGLEGGVLGSVLSRRSRAEDAGRDPQAEPRHGDPVPVDARQKFIMAREHSDH